MEKWEDAVVVVMRTDASESQLAEVLQKIEDSGLRPFVNPGVERKVVAVLGEVDIDKVELMDVFGNLAGVERVQLISEPFRLSSRQANPSPHLVQVGDVTFGGPDLVVIAGPCSV